MSSSTVSTPGGLGGDVGEVERVRGGLALGHEDAEDALGPEGARAEVGDEARVDAAGEADDGPAAAEVLVDDLAQALGDLVDRPPRVVEPQRLGGQLLSRRPFEPARLLADEAGDVRDRVEVLREDLLVGDLDLVALLDEADQLEDAGRVDHADLDQGVVPVEDDAVRAQREVVLQELADFLLDALGAGHDGQREVARGPHGATV